MLGWLLLVIAVGVCAAPAQIISGSSVFQQQPWMVAVLDDRQADNGRDGQICGGTLIAPQWVLTAAHCFGSLTDAADVSVAIGAGTLTGRLTRSAVSGVFIHPGFDDVSMVNDLALLRLAQLNSAPTLSLASTAQLTALQNGQSLTVMGWGAMTTSQPVQYASNLQMATLPFVDGYACAAYYGQYNSQLQLCAGSVIAGEADACWGDSGGPLLLGYPDAPTLAGIVSYGQGCSVAAPGVYTRAAAFQGWIDGYLSGQYGLQLEPHVLDFSYQGIGESETRMFRLQNQRNSSATLMQADASGLPVGVVVDIGTTGCAQLASGQGCDLAIGLRSGYENNIEQAVAATLTLAFDGGETLQLPLRARLLSFNTQFSSTLGLTETVFIGSNSGRSGTAWQQQWDMPLTEYVLASGSLSAGEESVLMAEFYGSGYLSFDWKVSSEPGVEGVLVAINGNVVASNSGDVSWQRKNIALPHARNRVTWIFQKNVSNGSSFGQAWLKRMDWQPGPVTESSSSGGKSALDVWMVMVLLALAVARMRQRQKRHQTL